ncbi:hypothetical protein CA267_007400 [Alteromonas pelagimontana]|uniref:Esterase-like activity of phytase family protein n=1 Tax=Alteromonas pelagimontana TaxID=1858656 RepID=A0A6M4MDF8_9ALTE|nr:hypothetical protein [Alteromonas pelagimontana]QJR80615.1 hypothetical protein CA267_007400 [Alteromonas pelagimontana]
MKIASLLCAVIYLSSCSLSTAAPQRGFSVIDEYKLNDKLKETSGLFCEEDRAYTINDSGNAPSIFQINTQGKIMQTLSLAEGNYDWETITADVDYFYVGDVGNNAGDRQRLIIEKVSRATKQVELSINLKYRDNQPKQNLPYAHDFDAEAMVAKDGDLLLFSKSWETGVARVYRLSTTKSHQTLKPIEMIHDLPGVITGADWDADNKRFLIVGYTSTPFGIFTPFIATLTENFEVKTVDALDGYGQVEGVCAFANNEIWFSQESAPFHDAKIVKIKFN